MTGFVPKQRANVLYLGIEISFGILRRPNNTCLVCEGEGERENTTELGRKTHTHTGPEEGTRTERGEFTPNAIPLKQGGHGGGGRER